MNWGYKILIVYLAFVAGIMYMVFRSSSQKVDLVTKDYYTEELKYQDKINEKQNTSSLSEEIKYEYVNDKLNIKFPSDFSGKSITGTLELYYPANSEKDVKIPFSTTTDSISVKIPAGTKGLYELKLNWQAEQIKYNYEKKIFL